MDHDGAIIKRSSSVITAQFVAGPTDYIVDFGQDVSTCVATATIADFGAQSVPLPGEILLTKGNDAEKIYVDARTSGGSDAGAANPFVIAVFC